MAAVISEAAPSQSVVRLYGRDFVVPRLQTAMGDDGLSYRYSGIKVVAVGWTPAVLEVKRLVERLAGERFNFCLINLYRDGANSISYHADDERDLDPSSCIAGVTFGVQRDFCFKHKRTKRVSVIRPGDGSLYIMRPPTNVNFKHALPPRKRLVGARLSLTFRRMVLSEANTEPARVAATEGSSRPGRRPTTCTTE